MTRLIGICGVGPGSGKTTTGDILWNNTRRRDEYDDMWTKWNRVSFASCAKRLLTDLTGLAYFEFDSPKYKDRIAEGWNNSQGMPRTHRELLIDFANGLREKISDDVWVKHLFSTWTENSYWLIDDVRFLTEIRKISDLGGLIIRVRRDNIQKDQFDIPDKYIHYEINNNGTLAELEDQIKEIIKIEELI